MMNEGHGEAMEDGGERAGATGMDVMVTATLTLGVGNGGIMATSTRIPILTIGNMMMAIT